MILSTMKSIFFLGWGGNFLYLFVCLFLLCLFLEKPLSDHEKDFRTHREIDRYDTSYND